MIYKEKWPQKSSKIWNFLIFCIFGGDYRAHGRHSGSSAMPLAEVIHEIRYKKVLKNVYFPMKNIFRKILKNRKFQKVTFSIFFEKLNFFSEKSNIFDFSKKSTFSKKVTFWNFRFFKIFRKICFIEKNKRFRIFFYFSFFIISHV